MGSRGQPKPIFTGKIYHGSDSSPAKFELEPASLRAFTENAKRYKNGELVKFTVSRLTKKTIRSVEQNNYYWGVVIKILAEDLGYIGTFEKELLHEELKAMFLVKRGKLGSLYVESTTRLDTETFERYLKAIRDWAREFQNIKIPKPNEVEEDDTYTRI